MKSKTSFFNATIFSNQLKRFWPLYASYFVLSLLVFPLPLNTTIVSALQSGGHATMEAAHQLIYFGINGGAIMSFFFGILFAMAAFHYLYNPRSASMMGALPIKREGVFLSVMLPGLVVMLLSNLLIFFISLLIGASHGLSLAPYALQALAATCLANLFFYGFACLCAMLTGHILVLPAVYVVLNFTFIVVMALIYGILNKIVYGLFLDGGYEITLSQLSPLFHIIFMTRINSVQGEMTENGALIDNGVFSITFENWLYFIIIAAVGLLMMLASAMLLKRRRMESAGDVVAITPLKPVFKYCLSAGCSLVIGLGLYYLIFSYHLTGGLIEVAFILLFMLIGAFIGYFAAEMMIQKTLRVFGPRRWKGMGVVALAIVALVLACELDVTGFEKRVPDPAQVEYVVINDFGYNSLLLEDEEYIKIVTQLHSSIVSNKKAYEASDAEVGTTLTLRYSLKNGSNIARRYSLYYDVQTEDLKTLEDFLNIPEIVIMRKTPSIEITEKSITDMYVSYYDLELGEYTEKFFTVAEAYELYHDCILPDIKDGNLGKITLNPELDGEYSDKSIAVDIYYQLSRRTEENRNVFQDFIIKPSADSTRTNRWLEGHGVPVRSYTQIDSYNEYVKKGGEYNVATETDLVPVDRPTSDSDIG